MTIFGQISGARAVRGVTLSVTAVGCMAMAPAPAMANASATAVASADVATSVRDAARQGIGEGVASDGKFKTLFASWKTLDNVQKTAVVPQVAGTMQAAVSIPSRLPVENARFSSSFGSRVHPVTGQRKNHHGLDMAAPTGTPIYATADGTVEMAKWYGGYGNYVQIGHGGATQTRYGHMSEYSVSAGQQVKKGDLIGFVGSTGRSTGPHLHYEVRIAGEPVDPTPYLQADTFQQAFASATGLTGAGGPE
ncbi:M23 family metallopeptidase [Croceicoccus sp. F390]|uniref:M23 family metallopeptidase n=1 Tax=Croceicoccus esteveae TaxID=3075597 RepID=A0ABU2ZDC0_9SPHN|nr:M23 family metallopeptidase [Croceicoccus sp. F390]MDT0574599.1 M23 family metallopeptidase [Croceicoccus sp. F390]